MFSCLESPYIMLECESTSSLFLSISSFSVDLFLSYISTGEGDNDIHTFLNIVVVVTGQRFSVEN